MIYGPSAGCQQNNRQTTRFHWPHHQQQVRTVGYAAEITSSGTVPIEGMGAVDQAVVDPVEVDPETAMADETEPAEAIADVADVAELAVDAAEQAEAVRTARANKAIGTTAAPCKIYAVIIVVSETTSR